MQPNSKLTVTALVTLALTGCSAGDEPVETLNDAAPVQAATPYKPVASVLDLMRGTITLAAEDYWASVSIVVDINGVTENMPETDLEWIEVWSAGMTLAESGNLLMMPPRALDNGDWIRISQDMVDVGYEAARVAAARDFEGVLDLGEQVYNVCVECHRRYVPALPDL